MMTLATTVRIVGPLPPDQVFHKCRELLGANRTHGWGQGPCSWRPAVHRYMNHRGGNLPAIAEVFYTPDGPMPVDRGGPECCVEVWFDTAWAFKDDPVLQRRLIAGLGEWLDERGADWWTNKDPSDEWHHRTPCPL